MSDKGRRSEGVGKKQRKEKDGKTFLVKESVATTLTNLRENV